MEEQARMSNDMCPICTQPFNQGEAVVQFQRWPDEPLRGHADCVDYLSRTEKREHPPAGDHRGPG